MMLIRSSKGGAVGFVAAANIIVIGGEGEADAQTRAAGEGLQEFDVAQDQRSAGLDGEDARAAAR